jgi:hypothetical protein
MKRGLDAERGVQTRARLPTGTENVEARYRKGIGLEGLVKAGQLTVPAVRAVGGVSLFGGVGVTLG